MTGRGSRTGSTAYREARTRLFRRSRRENAPCQICRKPIDYGLRYPDPESFSADHTTAHAHGGADRLANLRPTHLVCNQRRGAGPAVLAPQTSEHGFRTASGAWNPTTRAW